MVKILQCLESKLLLRLRGYIFGQRSFYQEVFLQVWKSSLPMKGIFTNLPLLFALVVMEIRVLFLLLTLQPPDTFLCTCYCNK